MWIYVRPASANVSLEVQTPDGGAGPKRQEFISFQVLPTDERDYLELDTGELFQDYTYARIRNKHTNLIGARLTIEAATEDADYRRSTMRYMDAVRGEFDAFPATIFFAVWVAPTTFQELADNVKSASLPETITIGFDRDRFESLFSRLDEPLKKQALEYNWEPDGSGKIWHNKEEENRIIPIVSVKFDYAILKPRHDEATGQLLPKLAEIPAARTNEQIALIQLTLLKIARHARWITVGVIVIAVLVAIWIIRHT